MLISAVSSYLPDHAQTFRDLFARLENALRRSGYSRNDQRRAVVDWHRFAGELGDPFFVNVCKSGNAATLIAEPPRAKHREGGWQPVVQLPVRDVTELIVRGVCQVRNNIVHGEKYVDPEGPRADTLVREAHWVLEQAINAHPVAKEALRRKLAK
jgi:hypothetical protein